MIASFFNAISKLLNLPEETNATPIDAGWLGDGDPGQIQLPRFLTLK